MSRTSIDAGKLDQAVEILELQESPAGSWTWQSVRPARAQVTLSTGRNLFSQVGIGARGAQLIVRRQAMTLRNALRWGEQHLFLTSIVPEGRLHLRLEAALVEPAACLAVRTRDTVGQAGRPVSAETMRVTFPGVLTEKYVRYEREETHAEQERCYALVTPKEISLLAGDLVAVQEGPAKAEYNVTACHVLDPYKNEYEIVWRRDV